MNAEGKLHRDDGSFMPVKPSLLNALPHIAPLTFLPLLILASIFGSWWIAGPLLLFALMEPIDRLSGSEERNMELDGTTKNRLVPYDFMLWLWVVGWPPTLVIVLWNLLASGHLAIWETVLIAVALGQAATIVLVAAHELLHMGSRSLQRVAEFLLGSVGCAQYAIDHIYVHHVNVGTPRDPASARKGEGFWRYLPRSYFGNLASGWGIARMRLSRRGLPLWHHTNPFWRLVAWTAAWYAYAGLMAGIWGIAVFLLVNLLAILSLRMGDYIEHYGLQRIYLPTGRFERTQLHHSWNAVGRLSNWMYYNTQRHSDHHLKPSRLWPMLQNHVPESAPRFPLTYSAMFGLAMFPRRWFEMMDPLIDRWRAEFYPDIRDWGVYESAAFAARPDSFDEIAEIFTGSTRLRKWVERDPALLDNLQQREFVDIDLPKDLGLDQETDTLVRQGLVRLYWTYEFGVSEMMDQIAETAIPEITETVESVRNWTNSKVFQISFHAMRGNLTTDEAAHAYVNVAEAALASVLSTVEEVQTAPYSGSGAAMALLVGDAVTSEFSPGATLDILFIHDGTETASLESLCQRFRRAMRAWLTDNLLFETLAEDDRSLVSLDRIFDEERGSPPTEHRILTSARPVYKWGNPDAQEMLSEAWNEKVGNRSDQVTPDADHVRS